MKLDYELTIIFPVLNEKKNLEVLIPQFYKSLLEHVTDFEILVVDDNSSDGTKELVEDFQRSHTKLTYLLRSKNKSLPLSIYEGAQYAKFKNVCWLDADGSMHIEALLKLIQTHKSNQDNVVIGSRFVKGGGYKGISNLNSRNPLHILKNLKNSNDTILGMVLSNIFNKFLVRFFKSYIKDVTSGFIILNKEYLKKESFERSIYGEYFIYLIGDLIKNKIMITEIGYICETRLFGESKTAPNLRILYIRGKAYIKAAIICKRNLNES